jgi:hypothetical protein
MLAKDDGLEVNLEEIKFMLLSCHQYGWENHNVKTANRLFEIVAQFRYLGMTATNQNLIQEEIQSILNAVNSCYHSFQNHFCLLVWCLKS